MELLTDKGEILDLEPFPAILLFFSLSIRVAGSIVPVTRVHFRLMTLDHLHSVGYFPVFSNMILQDAFLKALHS